MLDLTRIRYFAAVADAGSFSRAARRMGVSQPTLSIQVARLEDEVGAPLFERHHTGVNLSAAGERLYAQARALLTHVEEMERGLGSDTATPSGSLRVGTVNSVGIYLLPEALSAFAQRHSRVHPVVRFEHADIVQDLLEAGEVDLALTAGPKPPSKERAALLLDDPLVLVCGRQHRFWRRRFVRPEELQGERLITFDAQSPTAKLIDQMLTRHKIQMETFIQTPQIAALIRMVRMDMGLAFLPLMALRDELDAGALHPLRFPADELHRGIWLSWNEPEEYPARQAFVECLREVAQDKGRRRRF